MAHTSAELVTQKCVPCEGGVPKLTGEQVREQLAQLTGWSIAKGGERIRKEWQVKNFLAAMKFFEKVAQVAEDEGHHPDLHLTSYRQVAIEIYTHAIGGLSENDFILAAKIDQLPVELKANKK